MNHEEFERLAQSVFEGRGDAHDRKRLESLAAGAPELRERLGELQTAQAALAHAGLEPLPPGLHEALIGAVRAEGRRRREGRGWLAFVTAAIQARPVHALGGAVAAGFVIGAVGLGLLTGGLPVGDDLASGTAASLPPIPGTATTTIAAGGAHVDLTSRREPEALVVRLDAREATAGEVTLAWDPASLRLSGVRWEGADVTSLQPAPGTAVMRIPAATGTELSFAVTGREGSAVRARLSTAGGDREVDLRLP